MSLAKLFVSAFTISVLSISIDSFGADVVQPLSISKPKSQVVRDYLKLHKQFSRKLCRGGVEQKFDRLYRSFRKTRYFIPVDKENSLDGDTIKTIIPKIEKKKDWIIEQIIDLKKKSNFKKERKSIRKIRRIVKDLLLYKRNHNVALKESSREVWRKKSVESMESLARTYEELLKEIPYLQSFLFPVDHLKARITYDELKKKDDNKSRAQANIVYMVRRLQEDGAQDHNGKASDMYLRSTLDTVYLALQDRTLFITENLRYDLDYVLGAIEFQTKKGKWHIVNRLREWRDRTKKELAFYSHLFDKVIVDGKEDTVAGSILKKKAKATFALRKYSLEKQKDAYLFWSKQSELMQALFSLETILYNEVGVSDPYYHERRDVAKVVINREEIPLYSELSLDDAIYYYLPNDIVNNPKKHKWLNVLFKEGEFSFTYFYIPGNVRIYCPDMSRRGRNLREKNVRVSLNMILDQSYKFEALRYFSRESMTGRINMASVWTNYQAVPERPADRISRPDFILKAYKKGRFKYLYHFFDSNKELFEVIQVGRKNYVLSSDKERVYGYRNPHKFTYFTLKD